MKNKIGFWGYPPPEIIKRVKNEYPKAQWFDLDFDLSDRVPDANILPESYCKIIKQIINNSIYFQDELIKIIAPVGKDKCDSGWFAAQLLKDMGFNVEETKFESFEHRSEVVISTSNMPLYDKITTITANIVADKLIIQILFSVSRNLVFGVSRQMIWKFCAFFLMKHMYMAGQDVLKQKFLRILNSKCMLTMMSLRCFMLRHFALKPNWQNILQISTTDFI